MNRIESDAASARSPRQGSAPSMATPAPTAALAQFASELSWNDLGDVERAAARRHLLDTLGACVAGVDQPVFARAVDLLELLSGTGEVPIVGTAIRTNLLSAAYLTAVSCHAIELDDGNRQGSIHPGTAIVPALLTAGHALDVDGATLLCAVVAGYEVAVSLAEVLHPNAARRGFQTTGVAGVVGAAAGVARLLKCDATTVEKAMGIAASSSAGIFAYLAGGGNVKKLHPAHAAREGVLAAMLAHHGVVDGPVGVAEAKAGLFEAFAGIAPWTGDAVDHRGGALAITRSYLKPYPCCRHIHPAIDAIVELTRTHGIHPDAIERVDVGTYDAAMPHAHLGWDSFTLAQLSFPYVMAAAMRTGRVDLATFSEAARSDPRVAADVARIHVSRDSECCASYPGQGPARVTITMVDGTRHATYVAQPLGAPENPMANEAVTAKFRMAVAGRMSANDTQRAIDVVRTLEHLESARTLVHALCIPSVPAPAGTPSHLSVQEIR